MNVTIRNSSSKIGYLCFYKIIAKTGEQDKHVVKYSIALPTGAVYSKDYTDDDMKDLFFSQVNSYFEVGSDIFAQRDKGDWQRTISGNNISYILREM